jgi:hypothetical protein
MCFVPLPFFWKPIMRCYLGLILLASPMFSAAVFSAAVPEAMAADFALRVEDGKSTTVLQEGKPIARYVYALDLSNAETRHETYKPFLHLMNAAGDAPITKGPGGRFTHHRGVFRGWSKLRLNGKTYDTWHMKGNVQAHLEFAEAEADDEQATLTSLIRFRTDEGTPLLQEHRTMQFGVAPGSALVRLDVTSIVHATEGTLVLDGDPEHAGLQFRPANEVVDSETRYAYPVANADPHRDLDYPWVAESYVVDGQRYAVVYLNHPDNAQQARTSAYRSYGRFGMWFRDEVPAGEQANKRPRESA